MASFTIELHRILAGLNTIEDQSRKLRLTDYPAPSDNYRLDLNGKIVRHFWNQEIGLETVDQFVFNLHRKMHEIMPFYKPLMESTLLKIEPLLSVDIETSSEAENNDTAKSTSKANAGTDTNSVSRAVNSDTPQMMLNQSGDYATAASDSNSQNKSTVSSDDTSSSDSVGKAKSKSRTRGFQGSQSALLNEYRTTILNLDMEVIRELDPLFMAVWGTNDEYTRSQGHLLW